MNFGREQALLRQRLTQKASPERAAALGAQHGCAVTFLGADDAEIAAAAADLAATYPQMGRAQMTAFVRTLWQSRVHELRAVGVEILALRAALLEPPDLPFLTALLKDEGPEAVAAKLAGEVLGPLVGRNKKLWKELQKLAKGADDRLRRAAVQAAKAPVQSDATAFARFEALVSPLLAEADELLQQAIDEVVQAAARQDAEAAAAFAAAHGRRVRLPKSSAPKAGAAEKAVAAQPAAKAAKGARKASKAPAGKKAGAKTRKA